MRTLFILVLSVLELPVSAQNWCLPQAVWHHTYADMNGGVFGYVRTEYTGDTLLDGTMCQRLESIVHGYDQQFQVPFTSSLGTRFTRGQADLVEIWNGSGFDTLYAFAASPGYHWNVDPWAGGVTVQDTGTLVISGLPLRYLVVQFDEFQTGQPQDTILERLGFLHYYWDGQSAFLFDTGLAGLRCYTDVDVAYAVSDLPACTFILSVADEADTHAVLLAPNPATAQLLVQGEFLDAVRIRDASGRVVVSRTFSPRQSLELDIQHLPAGVYLVDVRQGGAWSVMRLLKE